MKHKLMNLFNQPFDINCLDSKKETYNFNKQLFSPLNRPDTLFTLYGRNALYLGLMGISKMSSKREVLVPSYSCGDELQTIINAGFSIKPYTIDCELNSKIDEIINLISDKTVAILVAHFFGLPHKNIDAILKTCRSNNIYLIEDCAHCCGGSFKGKPLGLLGDISVFSLRKTQNIPHGGALVVNNKNIVQIPKMIPPGNDVVSMDLFLFMGYRNGLILPGSPLNNILKKTTNLENREGARHDKGGAYFLEISNLAKIIIKNSAETNQHNQHVRSENIRYY
ncbi:MAG: DegT/DnrJ/EryC1/StrS family aminotransferase, partial [Nanoarchaeota archaeon]